MALAVLLGNVLVFSLMQAVPAQADTVLSTPLQVNFQTQSTTTPSGYQGDYGQAYDATRGYGWIDSTGNPLNLVGNGRQRNVSSNPLLDTLMQMQLAANSPGVHTPGSWKASIANGTYQVTVAVGDPSYTDSHDVINLNGTKVIDFTPTAGNNSDIVTTTVTVTNGFLTVDPTGGTNTKIDYIQVNPQTTGQDTITSVSPANGATGVCLDTGVNVVTSNDVNGNTVNSSTFQLLDSSNNQVAGHYNIDGASEAATFQPSNNLATNMTYTVKVTSGMQDPQGNSYAPFTSTFTTGNCVSHQASPANFNKALFDFADATSNTNSTYQTFGPSAMALGPNPAAPKQLWVANNQGVILVYNLDPNTGQKTGTPTFINTFKFSRLVTSIVFDPSSTDSNIKVWISNNEYGCDLAALGVACDDFTGAISVLQGSSTTSLSKTDVVTGLPRSVGNHMTNGLSFGPDGAIYLAQAAENGYGAPDATWGNRAEDPLSAAVLRVDQSAILSGGKAPYNVTTPAYNYKATGALVVPWADGIRNPYSLIWDPNGKLYAPVNESAGGNTPASSNGAPALNNLPAFNDYFTQIVQGKYYGHPNPARGENLVLNGGNPTSGVDPFEVPQYPVGTQPDANWRKPDLDLGIHRSADGTTLFQSNVFGGTLQGDILTTEYSNGKDILAIGLDSSGKPQTPTVVANGFYNPLPIVSDPSTGRIYVGEYGRDPDGLDGQISLLTPNTNTTPPPPPGSVMHVDFGSSTTTPVSGYTLDFGQSFSTTTGFGWETNNSAGTPLSLVGNGRQRNVNPGTLGDTLMQMQALNGSGNTTPGKWVDQVPNGTYSVTVGVGDPSYTNSVDVLNANGQQIVNFTPTTAQPETTATANVTVTNGLLTIDPTGGTNTKIDYIDIAPQGPTATITPSGTKDSQGNYTGSATITIAATDTTSGATIKSINYTLDGGASQTYSSPFQVTAPGSHTVVATATDSNNVTSPQATSTFTIASSGGGGQTPLQFQFGPTGLTPVTGYTADTGGAFDSTAGFGWENNGTGAPESFVGNGRTRGVNSNPLLDSLMQFQLAPNSPGNHDEGRWETVIPNGAYSVTLGVGDPSYTDSHDVINIEGQKVVDFTPTSATPQTVVTANVTVADGRLTVDPTGGTNTKIDYIQIAAAGPAATVTPSGTQDSSGNFVGSATVTINATASGSATIKSINYTLDGGASQTYTGPFQVTAVGQHTVTATATDSNNVTSPQATSTFNVVSSSAGSTTAHYQFGPAGLTPVTGYTADTGGAFDSTAGFGWENNGTGAPESFVGNGRTRGVNSNKLLDSLMQPQLAPQSSGNHDTGRWEAVVQNGTYTVTIGVGDPSYTDSHDVFNVEGQKVVDFTPTTATPQTVVTADVTVADGRLTVDPVGGTNSKIDYIDIVPQGSSGGGPGDTTAPTVTINVNGTTNTSGQYLDSATVTINAVDNTGGSGVKSTTYTLDGGAPQTYTGPFQVSTLTPAPHVVSATSTDNSNNTSNPVSKSFTVVSSSGGGPTPTSLQVSSPDSTNNGQTTLGEDHLGLGSRMVFSTVGGEVRTGHSITLKNAGSGTLNVTNLTFSGTPADFKLCSGQAKVFSIAAGATAQVCVQYVPTVDAVTNGTQVSQGVLTIASNDATVPNYQVTLGGVNAQDQGSFHEPSLQQIFDALGFKDNVNVTDKPQINSISSSSQPQGDEILAPYFKALNTSKPVQLIPIAHYSGQDNSDSGPMGWYPKGSSSHLLFNFQGGANGTNDGYGQNQLLMPTIQNCSGSCAGSASFSPTGSFGIVNNYPGYTNHTDDALNGNQFHGMRVYPAKNGNGQVIPGEYLIGDDIGQPNNNSAKNWDYQDFAYLLTNATPDTSATQPVAGDFNRSLSSFPGNAGGVDGSGFTSAQGTVDTSKISYSNGNLNVVTVSDSNTSHTNALMDKVEAGDPFRVQARLVGPFDAINAGAEQQAIYFGLDSTHYIKAEVEWQAGDSSRHVTIWEQNGSTNGFIVNSVKLNGGNASSVDLRIDIDPSPQFGSHYNGNPLVKVSYAENGSSTFTSINPTSGDPSIPANWITAHSQAGIMTSNQQGGSPFTATYANFSVSRINYFTS